jgi:hypothetical protein
VTRLKLPAFRSFVESTAWAIHPERGRALLDMLEARATDRFALSPVANDAIAARQAGRSDQRTVTKSGGAIAVLPMYGVVAQRMDMMMAYCGGTRRKPSPTRSTPRWRSERLGDRHRLRLAGRQRAGHAGAREAHLRTRAARARRSSPSRTADGLGGVLDLLRRRRSRRTPSGEVGSIGVFCVHVDQSAMNEMVGLKYTLIKAGEHKAENESVGAAVRPTPKRSRRARSTR